MQQRKAAAAAVAAAARGRRGHIVAPMRYSMMMIPLFDDAVELYRATMTLATCICILAVDFNCFPARFTKQEAFGFSLMDLGVGSYAFSLGLSASRRASLGYAWRRYIKSVAVLLLLGLLRLTAITLTKYHVDDKEYGRHWNFFFTLAALKAALAFIPQRLSAVCGILVLLVHQTLLSAAGLQHTVLHEPRADNFMSQNREGLVSSVGCLAVSLLGCAAGASLHNSCTDGHWKTAARRAAAWGFAAWAGVAVLSGVFDSQPSRRVANASFVVWTVANNLVLLAGCFVAYQWSYMTAFSLRNYLSRFQLQLFLLANVMTGAVNLSINTRAVSDSVAVIVVVGYTAALAYCRWWPVLLFLLSLVVCRFLSAN
eukprot:m.71355 g.71355  ORF g.71355 m.71355 type:complete len:370 (-) comp14361_c0_seq2:342-1451(-)